ncbi:hypothetical protein BX600DRAFT_178378 [Xylariales sp. PMI_506]|nr:hypothetical protein BX600DRAFT_178378 [Xylariales sp. PMI_506]
MAHVGTAMERSLGEPQSLGSALRDLVVRSIIAGISKRDAITSVEGKITDVKTAFSSWDNCMEASFCKWPVIAVIIVGGLILLSIVWCCARCLCCGLSCCCECCYCLKCCGNCCGCCDPPEKRHKYLDDPYVPPHHDQGYRSEAPMAVPKSDYSSPAAVARPEPPQYAEFETSKKGNGDELPQMPSWETASSKKVMIEDDSAVEMNDLKKPESAQSAPLMAPGSMSVPASPNPVSPVHSNGPYAVPGQNGSTGYMAPSRAGTDPYSSTIGGQQQQQQQGYNNYANTGYGQSRDNVSQGYGQTRDNVSPGYGNQGYNNQGYGNQSYANQGYDNQAYGEQGYGAAAAVGQGRRTPHQDYNNGGGYGRGAMTQGYQQSRTPRPYDEYGRGGPSRNGTPGSGPYGRPAQRPSPAPGMGMYGNQDRTQSPAPTQGGYDYNQRTNTPNSYGRQYPPAPRRQYTSDSNAPTIQQPAPRRPYMEEPPRSPIQNTGGFDFTSGFSRAENISPEQAGGGSSAYPGHRPYKAPQQF